MSKFTDYIDGFADKTSTLAKDELKELIISAKKDKSEFVRLQAENVERWTVMLAAGELTPAGYKKLVLKLDVLANVPYAVIARSVATRQSRFNGKSRLMRVESLHQVLKAYDNTTSRSHAQAGRPRDAQRLANGIQKYLLDGLCKLIT